MGVAGGVAIGCDGHGPVMQSLWEIDGQIELDISGFMGGKFEIGGVEMEISISSWGGKCCSDVLVGAIVPDAWSSIMPIVPASVGITTSEVQVQRPSNCGQNSCPWNVGVSVTGYYAVFELIDGFSPPNQVVSAGVFAGYSVAGLVGPLIALDFRENGKPTVLADAAAIAGGTGAFLSAAVATFVLARRRVRQRAARSLAKGENSRINHREVQLAKMRRGNNMRRAAAQQQEAEDTFDAMYTMPRVASGWGAAVDPSSGHQYYFNSKSGRTTWTVPGTSKDMQFTMA